MSSASQFLGTLNSASVLPDVPVQTGETFAVGDYAMLDYQGKAIKASAAANIVALAATTNLNTLFGVYEYALNKYLIIAARAGIEDVYIFYDKTSNAVTATQTITTAGERIGQILDVRALPNGDVVVAWAATTNLSVQKFSAAGAKIGTVAQPIALSSLYAGTGQRGTMICPSPVTGEYFLSVMATTGSLLQVSAYHYNSAGAYQGATAASNNGTSAIETTGPYRTACGNGVIMVIYPNAGSNALNVITWNATTRAIVGQSSFGAAGLTVTDVADFFYDATNTQMVSVSSAGVANICGCIKWSTTTGLGTLVQSHNGIGSGKIYKISATGYVYVGSSALPHALEYSSASGGTFTKKRLVCGAKMSTNVVTGAYGAPNYGAVMSWNADSNAGATYPYVYIDDPVGKHCFSVNPSTGSATGVFSYAANPALLSNKPNTRTGARYEIYVYLETVTPTTNQLTVRRVDAGILLGRVKKASASLVDVDTSQLAAVNVDAALEAVRPDGSVLVNNIEYKTGV
jgi:hypothetical protein